MTAARTFDSLRRRSLAAAPSNLEPIERVLKRLLASGDGQRVLDWMIAATHGPCPQGASDERLREAEGARRFVNQVCLIIAEPEADAAEK